MRSEAVLLGPILFAKAPSSRWSDADALAVRRRSLFALTNVNPSKQKLLGMKHKGATHLCEKPANWFATTATSVPLVKTQRTLALDGGTHSSSVSPACAVTRQGSRRGTAPPPAPASREAHCG